MTLLVLGVALWWAAHLFKRVMPDLRTRMGDRGKGLIALELLASVVLMVIGYRMAEKTYYWGPNSALVGINNLLMLLAFYLFAVSGPGPGKPRVWLGTKLRHPMLTGFAVWAFSHLIVNGDTASFVLFGGLLVWALVEIVVINRAVPEWTPPPQAGRNKEIAYVGITIVVVVVVMLIHNWLGVRPWG